MSERPETVRFYRMRLPHWEVVRGRYFVTIRLKGSIPDQGLQRIRFLTAQAEHAVAVGFDGAKERHRALMEMERWLHAAPRVGYLANPGVAEAIEEAIRHREEQGIWTMFSHVVMPNHIHLFFRLGPRDEAGQAVPLPTIPGLADPSHRGLVDPVTTYQPPSQAGSRAVDERAGLLVSDEETGWRRQKLRLDRVIVSFKRWTATQAAEIAGFDFRQFWQREWFDHWSRSLEEDDAIERYIRQNQTHKRRLDDLL